LQALLFFKFIYSLYNSSINFNQHFGLFSQQGSLYFISADIGNFETLIFGEKDEKDKHLILTGYTHYKKNLLHISIVQRKLYFSYIKYKKVNNKLKIPISIYSQNCTKFDSLTGKFNTFDHKLNDQLKFVDFFHHFITSSYLIFHDVAEHGDFKNKTSVYKIKKKLNELSINKTSNSNLLTFGKLSFAKEYEVKKEKILYDIFTELESFYEIFVTFTNQFSNITKSIENKLLKEKPNQLKEFCLDSFQLIRDVSILVYKSAFFITKFILEEHKLLENHKTFRCFERNEMKTIDIMNILIYTNSQIKLMIENFGIEDKREADVGTFLPADLKDIIFNHTLLTLEVLTCQTNFDFNIHKELKIILYIMLKFIKILPSINAYFILYELDADKYFQKICILFSIFLVEYGEQVLVYKKK
jgi:hypothetical protein